MTTFGTKTINNTLHFLTKNGEFCTTCCTGCIGQVLAYVFLAYNSVWSLVGWQGEGKAPWPGGYWRIRVVEDEYIPMWFTVDANKQLVGLPSQILNDYKTSWVELAFSCDNVIWPQNIYPPVSQQWIALILSSIPFKRHIIGAVDYPQLLSVVNLPAGTDWKTWKIFVGPDSYNNYYLIDKGLVIAQRFFGIQSEYYYLGPTAYNTNWRFMVYD